MKIEAYFTFAVEVDVEDRNDVSEIARKARPLIIDRINSDSIAECLQDILLMEEEQDGE